MLIDFLVCFGFAASLVANVVLYTAFQSAAKLENQWWNNYKSLRDRLEESKDDIVGDVLIKFDRI